MGTFDKTLVEGAEGAKSHVFDQPVKLVGGAEAPAAATTDKAGLVKKAAATSVVTADNAAAPAALTAAAAAGDAPTKAEHDKVVADLTALRGTVVALVTEANAVKAAVNSVINAQRNADQAEGAKS